MSKKIICGGFEYDDTMFEIVDGVLQLKTNKELLIKSSTPSSTKVFKITVVDNGTIAATEVV